MSCTGYWVQNRKVLSRLTGASYRTFLYRREYDIKKVYVTY